MSVGAASKYCCEKRMKLLSLETRSELKCLGRESMSKFFPSHLLHQYKSYLAELKNVVADSKFWTSASSDKCPREFGWCGSSELMDFEELEISRTGLDASKLCLTTSINPSTSALTLKEDECANNRARAICEVAFNFISMMLLVIIFYRCPTTSCVNAQSAGNSSVQRRYGKKVHAFLFLSLKSCFNFRGST